MTFSNNFQRNQKKTSNKKGHVFWTVVFFFLGGGWPRVLPKYWLRIFEFGDFTFISAWSCGEKYCKKHLNRVLVESKLPHCKTSSIQIYKRYALELLKCWKGCRPGYSLKPLFYILWISPIKPIKYIWTLGLQIRLLCWQLLQLMVQFYHEGTPFLDCCFDLKKGGSGNENVKIAS